MRRGDVVVVALQGDYGKPRPAVIVQSDRAADSASVIVLPITSTIVPGIFVRVDIAPSPTNGLRVPSQVMVDKVAAVPRAKVGQAIGRVDNQTMQGIGAQLAILLDLA